MSFLNKKDEIINATIENISKFGIDGTTMKNIALDCGIKSASIYYFFKSKEELVLECVDIILSRHLESLISADLFYKNISTLDSLNLLLDNIVKFHKDNPIDTMAYLQLINSHNLEIQEKINHYQFRYSTWLADSFEKYLSNDNFDKESSKLLLEYIVLLSNALFWESIVYSSENMPKRLAISKNLLLYSYKSLKK